MKIFNKVNNQKMAYERKTDILILGTLEFLQSEAGKLEKILDDREKEIKVLIKKMVGSDELMKSALGVCGIGEMTVAYCRVYIDLEKARHASSLWKYVGLDKPSHSRYEKNSPSGGNKSLRTGLYRMAEAQVKLNGAYREVYDRAKAKKEKSTKLVESRNRQGKLVKVTWKDAMKSHRHGHALRLIIKHFLADYWFVGRTLQGLPTAPLYAEAVLKTGHKMIMPEERGWVYF